MSDNSCTHKTNAGELRKSDAQALLEAHRESYIRRGRRALLKHLLDYGSGTIDDVRDVVDLPSSVDPVCMGAVPGPLARAKIIMRDGYMPTKRPSAHARPVSRWRLCNAAKAEQWLATHPDLPKPNEKRPTAPTAGHQLPLFKNGDETNGKAN